MWGGDERHETSAKREAFNERKRYRLGRDRGRGEIQGKNDRLDSYEAQQKRSQEPLAERHSLTPVSQQPRAQRIILERHNGRNDGERRKEETQVGKEYEARSNGKRYCNSGC